MLMREFTMIALGVTQDLIFSTKIVSTAKALGVPARSVAAADALAEALEAGDVRLVMVDMSLPDKAAVASVERAVAHSSRPTVIAFYSHVQGALGEAARTAGATRVMPRSKFSEQLPELLRSFCLPPEAEMDQGNSSAG